MIKDRNVVTPKSFEASSSTGGEEDIDEAGGKCFDSQSKSLQTLSGPSEFSEKNLVL